MPAINTVLTLADLPSPPSGKTGWPWTEETPLLPNKMPDGSECPKISIVTPNYNYGQFIEETIRSVLLQGYPNLEYIVIDGGSTDNSVEIIKKYEPWLTYWVSEPDKGQSHAINKGFVCCTGEIMAWLNSDDCFNERILYKIASIFIQKPETNLITCPVRRITSKGKEITITHTPSTIFKDIFYWSYYMPQAGVFFKKKILDKVGYLDESLQIQMDYDFWFRFAKKTDFLNYQEIAANIKIHPEAKTTSNKYQALSQKEALLVKLRYADEEIKNKILNELVLDRIAYNKLRNSFWIKVLIKLKLL